MTENRTDHTTPDATTRKKTTFQMEEDEERVDSLRPPTPQHHKRPTLSTRKSFTQSVSSFSLYNSHFAGERWEYHHKPGLHHEKTKTPTEVDKEEVEEEEEEQSEVCQTNTPTSSTKKAMFMFLKAFIGSGVLFLPKGFEYGGLALSIVLMIVIASICLFSFLRLVRTQEIVGGSYGDVGHRLYGRTVRYMVLFFIIISQVGFVCSYFIFISGNLVSVVQVLSHCRVTLLQKSYIWMPLVIVLPLILVRHITRLSLAVILADLFILFGLICVIYFTSYQLIYHGPGPNIQSVNTSNFALMIGTATFSFEGIGLVIPIAESMERPEKFPLVVSLGTIIVCVIYIVVGSMSYLAYGDQIQAAVVYNFPPSNPLTITVQLLYSVAIILTIPLMLFPAIKIIENGVFQKCPPGSQDHRVRWLKNLFRCVLTVLCATIAYLVGGDNLDRFVAFVGSIACIPLCYIFPGIFHLKITNKRIERVTDIALIVWGVGIMIYTLYVTISTFSQPSIVPLEPYCPV